MADFDQLKNFEHLKILKIVVDSNRGTGEFEDTQDTLEDFFKLWVFN